MVKKASTRVNRHQAHTARSPKGLGDFYGTGIVQPLGRMRSGMGQEILSPKKLKKAPKSLA
jgi:hypothetical protein